MRGDFVDRRYSDDELRRIFEDAARSDVRSGTTTTHDGHTLAEIRAIAEEVGIDPAAVDRAAANLVASEPAPAATSPWLTFARVLHAEHVIPRPLTNAEMRLVALQAERVLGSRGTLRDTGNWVEWQDAKDRLYVGVVRGNGQTRIRAIADHSREVIVGASFIGGVGVLSLASLAGMDPVLGVATGLLIGAATLGLIGLYSRWRSGVTRRHLHDLLDILQDAVRGT